MEINWVHGAACSVRYLWFSFVFGAANEWCTRARATTAVHVHFGSREECRFGSSTTKKDGSRRRISRRPNVRRPAERQIEIESKTKLKMCVCAIQNGNPLFGYFYFFIFFSDLFCFFFVRFVHFSPFYFPFYRASLFFSVIWLSICLPHAFTSSRPPARTR